MDYGTSEIAVIDRLLRHVDANHLVLPALAQWLCIWEEVRGSFLQNDRVLTSGESSLRGAFAALIKKTIDTGKRLVGMYHDSGISGSQLVQATGCSVEAFEACLELLKDFAYLGGNERLSAGKVEEVWRYFTEDGPSDTVAATGA